MKEIKVVYVIGAGAMGAYFLSRFLECGQFTTGFAANGERLEKLKTSGVTVNGQHYQTPVVDLDQPVKPADLIIVALKHHHLPQAIPDMKNLVGSDTMILSVMNGLDSEALIGAEYGMNRMLYAISLGIDAVRQGNEISYSKPGKHIFGEADNKTVSDRVLCIQRAFDKAGITYETPIDMKRMLWWKFMINVGMNPSSAVMHAPYGVFQKSPEACSLMEALMREVIMLAKAKGIHLTEQDLQDWYPVLNSLSTNGKTSMLQDMEAGLKTEVEIFSQKVVELGKVHHIPTPVNETVLNIVKVLENKNRHQ